MSRLTKAELEQENHELKSQLASMFDQISQALGVEDEDEEEDEQEDEELDD